MKPKELIPALWAEWTLSRIPVGRLTANNRPSVPVIVSLTAIESRLNKVHVTVRSLLTQSLCPEKIILWLNDALREKIPASLLQLEGAKFEIRFSWLDCAHLKLVESLRAFPEYCIVTCDDDAIYEKKLVESLYREHEQYPEQIITNRCNLIGYDSHGSTLPYKQWKKTQRVGFSSLAMMPAGYGGVLYPPGCFSHEVTNAELFLKLSPKADDLWFKAMSFLHGTQCRRAKNPTGVPITIAGTQRISLRKSNVQEDKNREQWDALREYFQFKTPDLQ